MSVRMRQEVERKIAAQVIDDLLAAGYAISVEDGAHGHGEPVLTQSRYKPEILAAMFSTDDDRLLAHRPQAPRFGLGFFKAPYGWVVFVYGNNGPDVIHYYTTNLEDVIEHAEAVADYYDDGDQFAENIKVIS